MCEPYHSIVQYPNQDDDGNPTRDKLSSTGKLLSWGKKILDYFHFSKLGSGHSGATEFGLTQERLLPLPTSYEAHWWDRVVRLDGEFQGPSFNRADAIECAEEYANRTSIGNLSIFRRFLEGSLRATNRPYMYIDRMLSSMLTAKGRDALSSDLKKRFGVSGLALHVDDRIIKTVMGYTRKRELLLPPWADDDKLWTPGQ